MSKTIAEINEKIKKGEAVVVSGVVGIIPGSQAVILRVRTATFCRISFLRSALEVVVTVSRSRSPVS